MIKVKDVTGESWIQILDVQFDTSERLRYFEIARKNGPRNGYILLTKDLNPSNFLPMVSSILESNQVDYTSPYLSPMTCLSSEGISGIFKLLAARNEDGYYDVATRQCVFPGIHTKQTVEGFRPGTHGLFGALTVQEKRRALNLDESFLQKTSEARKRKEKIVGDTSTDFVSKMTDHDIEQAIELVRLRKGAMSTAEAGEHKAAILLLQAILAGAPFDSQSRMRMGIQYAHLNDMEKAIECLEHVRKDHPNDQKLHDTLEAIRTGTWRTKLESKRSMRTASGAEPEAAKSQAVRQSPPQAGATTAPLRTSSSARSANSISTQAFVNSLGMRLVLIPAGTFIMGSPQTEEYRDPSEVQHAVTLSKPFPMAIATVTNQQFRAFRPGHDSGKFMGDSFQTKSMNGDDQPVVEVSWEDAVDFCEWLGKIEGRKYRLPTEAEWEYACRGGCKGQFCHALCMGGDPPWGFSTGQYQEIILLDEIAWFGNNSGDCTHPVMTKKPNAWGIYDMLGNVAEWCLDAYGEYESNPITDPLHQGGGDHVVRGGYWRRPHFHCRCASRSKASRGNNAVGFRIVATG